MIRAIELMPLQFTAQKEWRVWIVFAFFLCGLGAGAFLVSSFFEVLAGMVLGWIAVALGAAALLVDLGRPERFYRAVMKPGSSWISRGFVSIVVFVVFGLLYMAPYLVSGLPWTGSDGVGIVFRIAASLGAFMIMLYTGFVMSASPAIPFWNTTILPVMFLLYSLMGGLDLIFITNALGGKGSYQLEQLELLQTTLMAASVVFIFAYMLIMHESSPAGAAAVKLLTKGGVSAIFLGGVIFVGLIIPLIIMAYSYVAAGAAPMTAGIAGFLTLTGSLLFRWSVLRAGLYAPLL